jgi:hypothetical protein
VKTAHGGASLTHRLAGLLFGFRQAGSEELCAFCTTPRLLTRKAALDEPERFTMLMRWFWPVANDFV